jgi:hypothetical protein
MRQLLSRFELSTTDRWIFRDSTSGIRQALGPGEFTSDSGDAAAGVRHQRIDRSGRAAMVPSEGEQIGKEAV